MKLTKHHQHGLRVTIRLHGDVISQEMLWRPRRAAKKPVVVGSAVPTPSGRPLVQARWLDDGRVNVEPLEPSAAAGTLTPEGRWTWSNNCGVDVDLDLVPRIHARRTSQEAWGDIALMVFMLTLAVGVGQINYLINQLIASVPTAEGAYEPTPELIARLLQEDFGGEAQAQPQAVQRPEMPTVAPSFFLPAGNDGDWSHVRGGAQAGHNVNRNAPQDDANAGAPPNPPALQVPPIGTVEPQPVLAERLINPDEHPQGLGEDNKDQAALPDPVERFIGWGFRDWFDVQDGRREVVERMAQRLSAARVKLAIDPDDPEAIVTAAYYAYLAEHYDLCKALYRQYIDRFPEDPAGYNNLALVLKRTREYREEEALYRKGLAINPNDTHVINNLAVNLGHQGRYTEAIQLLDHLDRVTPNDAYTDLHRSKIEALMGNERRALSYLRKALDGTDTLDTLHHIEFRQDIRVDPSFAALRHKPRFHRLLRKHYGDNAAALVGSALSFGGRHDG